MEEKIAPPGQTPTCRAPNVLQLAGRQPGDSTNPAHAVRGPKHVVKKGKTPVLSAEETRELLDSMATDPLIGLRDRDLIGLIMHTFARVGAVTKIS
jgi:site-specific recombinase XerD